MADRASYIASARDWRGGVQPPDWLADELEPGESVYLVSSDVELLELRKTQPPLMGGASDFDIDVAENIAATPAGARSVWVQEPVTAQDTGYFVVTSLRAQFFGQDLRRVWRIEDLYDVTHDIAVPETWLLSTNHRRPAGVRYPASLALHIRFCLAVALAEARGTRQALAASLQRRKGARGAKALGVAKFVYTGKPGVRTGLRVTQGVAAGFITLALFGAVIPSSPEDVVSSSSATPVSSSPSPTIPSEPDQAAEAQAEADRVAAEQQAEADRVAAQQAEAAKVEAARVAAARAAAQKAAAQKAAAQRAAAEKAAAEQAAAAAAAEEAAAVEAKQDDCHPAYATCIPIKGNGSGAGEANDLDCPDIGQQVTLKEIGNDPYRLDADSDGTGCDSY